MTNDRKPRILVLTEQYPYGAAVKRAGGTPICVSPRDVRGLEAAFDVENCDGMLLSGGGDVDPRLYGRKPHKKTYGVSELRDRTEMYAITEARERNWPVLGICRGAQIQTVEAGGVLRQHIPGHVGGDHDVITFKATNARRVMGVRFAAPSLHHQEMRVAGEGWHISGRGLDGTTEVVESLDGRCLGVQFHPERDPNADYSRKLFRWLVAEAATRGNLELAPQAPKAKASKKGRGRNSNVVTSWYCPECGGGMRFDAQHDFKDHMLFLHGVSLPA